MEQLEFCIENLSRCIFASFSKLKIIRAHFYIFRCGLPVCNEACEAGHLHSYECPIFAKAFDKEEDQDDEQEQEAKQQQAKNRKLPKIENMYAACPLYTCITPLRLLLRQKKAQNNSKEEVSQKSIFTNLTCCSSVAPLESRKDLAPAVVSQKISLPQLQQQQLLSMRPRNRLLKWLH